VIREIVQDARVVQQLLQYRKTERRLFISFRRLFETNILDNFAY